MDRRVFAQILDERKNAVYGYALYLLGNAEDAEDVSQDVFLKLWNQGDEVEPAALAAWLMRVCRNACLDRLRRKKVRRRHQADPSQTVVGAGLPDELAEASGREASFELSDQGAGALQIEQQIEIDRIRGVMEQLREPHRSVILLREIYDMTYEDIAHSLEISLSSVKVTLHRARKRVRDLLREDADHE